MEKPNLFYLQELARGDQDLINQLIEVLKVEFPEESQDYYKSIQTGDFKTISQNVHRVKHKISILGLDDAYKLANDYENNLRDANMDKKEEFEEILVSISEYLKTI
ncbi:histidine kinase [Tenacibaculum sp. SZ-18]|uniref:Hpt domain-containing protein n=1 Tax=Tenacibaculum sp. SZ-18 TaxID=754423 RepID=UPI000C2D4AF7|nr:Hpt domain-containing protein [Tenacibaculum sp. SZ-18]AUC15237.1 histidine kinase [Tenacibaculum sp. SZ-18]